MKKLFVSSIKNQLTLLFILSLSVVMLLVSITIYQVSSREVISEYKESSDVILHNLSINVDQYFEQIDVATLVGLIDKNLQQALLDIQLKQVYNPIENTKVMDQFLRNLEIILNGTDGIYLFTDEKIFYQAVMIGAVDYSYDYSHEPWFLKTLDKDGGIAIFGSHKPFPRSNSGYDVISISRGLKHVSTGQYLGVLLIDIRLSKMAEIFKQFVDQSDSEFAIIDEMGRIVYSTRSYEVGKEMPLEQETLDIILTMDKGDLYTYIGEEKMYLNFKQSAYTNWWVLQYISTEKMMKNSSRQLLIAICIVSCICFVLIICIAPFIAGRFSAPIVMLSKNVNRISKGNFAISMDSSREDELGTLVAGVQNMANNLHSLVNRVSLAKVKQKEAELQALQSQINPHFLYNTLESVQMRAVLNEQRDIAEMVGDLGTFFKLNVRKGNSMVTVKEELDYIELYLKIQKIRFGNRITYSCSVDQLYSNNYILRFLLQPLIENAIVHGMENHTNAIHIQLECYELGEYLYFCIEDNGYGIEEEKLLALQKAIVHSENQKLMKGLGLLNVNERLTLHFGASFHLHVESELGVGTRICFKVPFCLAAEELRNASQVYKNQEYADNM